MDTMSQRGQPTTLEERVAIAERASAGKRNCEIANELGRPLATIRKWRQRYRRKGREGLSSQMGRPVSGALGQSPLEVKDAILQMREAHPGWGPQTLRL
jgi:transposase